MKIKTENKTAVGKLIPFFNISQTLEIEPDSGEMPS